VTRRLENEISPEDLATFREAACRAFAAPPRLIGMHLPRRVRLRLRFHRCVDDTACLLICRGHCTAAMRLWQLFGMW
jgi:hypothetical protein